MLAHAHVAFQKSRRHGNIGHGLQATITEVIECIKTPILIPIGSGKSGNEHKKNQLLIYR